MAQNAVSALANAQTSVSYAAILYSRTTARSLHTMALRIRESGEVVCAAMHGALPGDVYINDGVHYTLSVEHRLLVTTPAADHAKHGLWWWRNEVPPGVEIDPFYIYTEKELEKAAALETTVFLQTTITDNKGRAWTICERCEGSGFDPDEFYDCIDGCAPDVCRACGGMGYGDIRDSYADY